MLHWSEQLARQVLSEASAGLAVAVTDGQHPERVLGPAQDASAQQAQCKKNSPHASNYWFRGFSVPISSMGKSLNDIVDTWTITSVAASGLLCSLYTKLGDEKQRSRAVLAGEASSNRMARLHLGTRLNAAKLALAASREDEALEEFCWLTLFEAQAGLCALYATSDCFQETQGMKAAMKAANKAFRHTLTGFRTAFPESLTEGALTQRSVAVASSCAAALVQSLDELPEDHEELAKTFNDQILKAILEATS